MSDGTFGEIVKHVLTALRWRQARLAEQAGIGPDQISRYVNNRTRARTQKPRGPQKDLRKEVQVALDAEITRQEEQHKIEPSTANRLRDLVKQLPQAPIDTPPTGTNERPEALGPLIGRDEDLEMVLRWMKLDGVRMITIAGPAGVGKTRLAQEVYARLDQTANRAIFCRLERALQASQIVPRLARTLDLPDTDLAPLERLIMFLGKEPHTLILDNMEHLSGTCGDLASILKACPGVTIVATSRQLLHVEGERAYNLQPLALPDADAMGDATALAEVPSVKLFLTHARAVRHRFAADRDTIGLIAAICRRLDGLPLPILTMISPVLTLSAAHVLQRLMDQEHPASDTVPSPLPGQETLDRALAASYDLLKLRMPPACEVFRRLAVFASGCTINGAVTLCQKTGLRLSSADLEQHLDALVAIHLLENDGPAGAGYYSMLHTVRDYGRRLAIAGQEIHSFERAHARYLLEVAAKNRPRWRDDAWVRHEAQAWYVRLRPDREEIQTAFERASHPDDDVRLAIQLAATFWHFWDRDQSYREGYRLVRQVLEKAGANPAAGRAEDQERAEAWCGAGVLAYRYGAYGAAEKALLASSSLWEKVHDDRGMADACNHLGSVYSDMGQYEKATTLFRQNIERCTRLDYQFGIARSYHNLAGIAFNRGNLGEAEELYQRASDLLATLGRLEALVVTWDNMANMAINAGQLDAAEDWATRSCNVCRKLGKTRISIMAAALTSLGIIQAHRRCFPLAEDFYHQALKLQNEAGDVRGQAITMNNLADAAIKQGRPGDARAWLRESLKRQRELGNPRTTAETLEACAYLLIHSAHQHELILAATLEAGAARLRKTYHTPVPLAQVSDLQRTQEAIAQARQTDPAPYDRAARDGGVLTPMALLELAETALSDA